MKPNFLLLPAICFLFGFTACNSSGSQSGDHQEPETKIPALTCEELEGKQYTITLTAGGKAENPEILSFKTGMVESSECLKYGFAAASFTCAGASDGSLTFETTMTSATEGVMKWKGTLTGSLAKGTVLWTKAGQADIYYTFEGPLN